ncbi:hypothetical protein [Streptomyces aidingensis]|uniref:Uncharacterized protein n=1 Tax=Streptomyces aidingensis TaxID=910347 RepID=A0A1I1MUT5_9ACTN|nr:hypothetical protein [Streptomyces aidingensis]SFC89131.1 hypothetical protein SAMN05421773_10776 [Streptomyces aidingensis]
MLHFHIGGRLRDAYAYHANGALYDPRLLTLLVIPSPAASLDDTPDLAQRWGRMWLSLGTIPGRDREIVVARAYKAESGTWRTSELEVDSHRRIHVGVGPGTQKITLGKRRPSAGAGENRDPITWLLEVEGITTAAGPREEQFL